MERVVKNFHNVIGFRLAPISAMILIFFAFSSDTMVPVAIFAAFLVLGMAFMFIGWMRDKKLARLKSGGIAYDADNVDFAPVNLIRLRGQITFRAYFTYTDAKSITHTTKTRWYCLRLGHSDIGLTPLDEFYFSAKVYVNPNKARDYAAEMFVEGEREGDEL